MTETLEVGGLVFEVRRSDRRKTFGVTVDRGGELMAYAPSGSSAEDLGVWLRKKLLWVHRKLALKQEVAPPVQRPEFLSGEAFYYLGRRFSLKVIARQEQPLLFNGNKFILRRGVQDTEAHFRRWYLDTGTEWLQQRVKHLSRHVNETPRRVEVRDLGFRWGSCTKDGVLLFNWKLLQLPVRLLDYVVMHELVHLVERHHRPAFWETLGRAMPDWQKRKETLAIKAKDYLQFGLPTSCGGLETE